MICLCVCSIVYLPLAHCRDFARNCTTYWAMLSRTVLAPSIVITLASTQPRIIIGMWCFAILLIAKWDVVLTTRMKGRAVSKFLSIMHTAKTRKTHNVTIRTTTMLKPTSRHRHTQLVDEIVYWHFHYSHLQCLQNIVRFRHSVYHNAEPTKLERYNCAGDILTIMLLYRVFGMFQLGTLSCLFTKMKTAIQLQPLTGADTTSPLRSNGTNPITWRRTSRMYSPGFLRAATLTHHAEVKLGVGSLPVCRDKRYICMAFYTSTKNSRYYMTVEISYFQWF